MNFLPRVKKRKLACALATVSVATAAVVAVPLSTEASAVSIKASTTAASSAQASSVKVTSAATSVSLLAVKSTAKVVNAYGYNLPSGPKLKKKFKVEHIGSYRDAGKLAYCIDYALDLTKGQSFTKVTSVKGLSTTEKEELAYILSRWGNTKSNNLAAANAVAIRLLIKDTKFTYDWDHSYKAWFKKHHPSVVSEVAAIEKYAKRYHGPFKVKASASSKAVYTGDKVTFTFTVSGPAGSVPAHTSFKFSGATLVSTLPKTTNAKGVTRLTVRRSTLGKASITLKASGLWQSSALLLSHPTKGQQRLIASSVHTTTASAKVTVGASPTTPSLTIPCKGVCNGHPTATLKWTNKSAAKAAVHVYNKVSGKLVKLIYVSPHASVSVPFTVTDRTKYVTSVNYYIVNHWSTLYKWSKTWTVDCPALPVASFTGCSTCATSTATFSSPKNNSSTTQELVVHASDGKSQTVVTKHGQTAKVSFTHKRGNSVTYSVSTGAKKMGGAWNLSGELFEVTLK